MSIPELGHGVMDFSIVYSTDGFHRFVGVRPFTFKIIKARFSKYTGMQGIYPARTKFYVACREFIRRGPNFMSPASTRAGNKK
jgi:hypothetical protein